ncbi:H/ACA RNA-protein complex protein Gar1 [Methanosarcinaceae archaeon]|nr:H/ACA RNA-protein complex protein Gar1 [Methanosarcinaceae archaeon]MBQ3621200.1 H/ACA RNA-protein complex protein Gar1 [Methanosarcinaceae archaeon]
MKRLGVVTSRHGHSCLVVKGDSADNSAAFRMMNAPVIDKNVSRIGKVVNVFGSETRTYFLVRIFREIDERRIKSLVSEKVYIR